MRESYNPDYSDLDEYLAEYVDNTMDPDVRQVFEELLAQDPLLAEHVCSLQEARLQLCNLQCACAAAPAGFQRRLRDIIDHERMTEEPVAFAGGLGSRSISGVCSLVLLVVIGINMLTPERAEAPRDLGVSTTAAAGVPGTWTASHPGSARLSETVLETPLPYVRSSSSSSRLLTAAPASLLTLDFQHRRDTVEAVYTAQTP